MLQKRYFDLRLSDNGEGEAIDQNICPDKREAKFPGSTEMIRTWFDGLSMKALDRDPALDLPCSQTVKDGMKQECEDSIRPLTRNVESTFHQIEIHSLQWTRHFFCHSMISG